MERSSASARRKAARRRTIRWNDPRQRARKGMEARTVIDCDVHHARRTDDELLDYLSPAWREYVLGPGPAGIVPLTVKDGYPNPHGFMRADTYPADGGPPGSDLKLMDEQLLGPAGTVRA